MIDLFLLFLSTCQVYRHHQHHPADTRTYVRRSGRTTTGTAGNYLNPVQGIIAETRWVELEITWAAVLLALLKNRDNPSWIRGNQPKIDYTLPESGQKRHAPPGNRAPIPPSNNPLKLKSKYRDTTIAWFDLIRATQRPVLTGVHGSFSPQD